SRSTTVVSAPRLPATAKGKQPARATTPTEPTDVERTESEQLKIILKRSRQETHISQQCGFGIDEGTGSRPGVLDVPSDDSEEELSWNSSDDEDVGEQTKGREESEGDKSNESNERSDDDNDETVKASSDKDDDDNDEEEEIAKDDDEDTESGKGGDEVSESEGESDEEETRQEEEESFDPIPRTPKGSEDEGNDEEDQELRLSEEARIQEEEEADELYSDVNINQGRGLQVTQNVEDSHVTLTPVNPDGPQESSSMLSFVTSMLNPIKDARVESIFTTASSPIVSLQTPTPIMTPSTIATITTSTFRFDERPRSLETTFFKYRQTNPFVDAVSAIPADLSEMELKKILIERMEGNKSIHEDERMMIRKDPPLDQTGGLKDKEKAVSMRQLALHLKQQPRVQADLPQGLNLDNYLLVSLLLQRNLYRLPV
nr:hypothetical protein [Tanacetum cinerariifolium]